MPGSVVDGDVMGLIRGLLCVYLTLTLASDAHGFGNSLMQDGMLHDNPFLRPKSVQNPYSFNAGHRALYDAPFGRSRREPRGTSSSRATDRYHGDGTRRGPAENGAKHGSYGMGSYGGASGSGYGSGYGYGYGSSSGGPGSRGWDYGMTGDSSGYGSHGSGYGSGSGSYGGGYGTRSGTSGYASHYGGFRGRDSSGYGSNGGRFGTRSEISGYGSHRGGYGGRGSSGYGSYGGGYGTRRESSGYGPHGGGYGRRRDSKGYGSQSGGYGAGGGIGSNEAENNGEISPEYVPGAVYDVPGSTVPAYGQVPAHGQDPAYGQGTSDGYVEGYQGSEYSADEPRQYGGDGYGHNALKQGRHPKYAEEAFSVEVNYGSGEPSRIISVDGEVYEGSDKTDPTDYEEIQGGGSSGVNTHEYQQVLNDVSQLSNEQFMPGSTDFATTLGNYPAMIEGYHPPSFSSYSSPKRLMDTIAPYKYFGSHGKAKAYDGNRKKSYSSPRAMKSKLNGGRIGYSGFGGRSENYQDHSFYPYSDKSKFIESPTYGSLGEWSDSHHFGWDDRKEHWDPTIERSQGQIYSGLSALESNKKAWQGHQIGNNFYTKRYAPLKTNKYNSDSFRERYRSQDHNRNKDHMTYPKRTTRRRDQSKHGFKNSFNSRMQLTNGQGQWDNKDRARSGHRQQRFAGYGHGSKKPTTNQDTHWKSSSIHEPATYTSHTWQERLPSSGFRKGRIPDGYWHQRAGHSSGIKKRRRYIKNVAGGSGSGSAYPSQFRYSSNKPASSAKPQQQSRQTRSRSNQWSPLQSPHNALGSLSRQKNTKRLGKKERLKMFAGFPRSLRQQLRPDRKTLVSTYRSGHSMRFFPFDYEYERRSGSSFE